MSSAFTNTSSAENIDDTQSINLASDNIKIILSADTANLHRQRSKSFSSGSSNTTATNTTIKAPTTYGLSPRTPKLSISSNSLNTTAETNCDQPLSQPQFLLDIEPSSPFFVGSKNILGFDSPTSKSTKSGDLGMTSVLKSQNPTNTNTEDKATSDNATSFEEPVSNSKKKLATNLTLEPVIEPFSIEGSSDKVNEVPSLPSTPLVPLSPSIISQGDDYFTPSSSYPTDSHSPRPRSLKSFKDHDVTITPKTLSSDNHIDSSPSTSITNVEAQNMALEFYNGTTTEITLDGYASWMGDEGILQKDTREAFMKLFTFKGKSILGALRDLCEKLYMKGESQQLHRIMESFSSAWHSMNSDHGFLDANIIYTIAYSLLLLNTDLYAADHTANKKISKSKFVSNALETIRNHVSTLSSEEQTEILKKPIKTSEGRSSHHRMSSFSYGVKDDTLVLVNDCTINLLTREWYFQLESVLKVFYASIAKEPLELHGYDSNSYRYPSFPNSNGLTSISSSTLNGSHGMGSANSLTSAFILNNNNNLMPSMSLTPSLRANQNSSSIFGRLTLNRLRNNRTSYENFNQSRIDFERGGEGYRRDSFSSLFSMESNYSLNFGFNRHAVGFAGLLATSMIKEDETAVEESFGDFSKIEEELAKEVELELLGAPWAKEGLLKYRPHIDPHNGKKLKRKDWTQVFVVVQKGQLKMFNFERSSSSNATNGGVVGSGNWMENANLVDGFHLCHTMAQELPSTKKARGYSALWSLTLPQLGVLVFQAGTKEIAREYVYTCNYWAGRLSKEPFDEPVSSMEYGWGAPLEGIEEVEEEATPNPASVPVTRLAHKSSSHNLGRILPGDRIVIKEWRPSGQSLIVSDVDEKKQISNLKEYVAMAEKNLGLHNALRTRMMQAFTPNSPNYNRAHSNWERKSQYLLQHYIRYKIYVDCLEKAMEDKAIKMKAEGDDVTIQVDNI